MLSDIGQWFGSIGQWINEFPGRFELWCQKFGATFKLNFIDDSRWQFITDGLKNTLIITLGALIIGVILGIIVASVRSTFDLNRDSLRRGGRLGYSLLNCANILCKLYLTIIRGTPVVVQLLIMYFIILAATKSGVIVAIITFGINSGAYVAEIFRGGIMSVDGGQFEAGRSLGFNYFQTMLHIILPQAFKNVLPTLCNEFIALLKETSVAGYVAVQDLTKGGYIIIGRTYSYYMPLIAVALIYLAIVIILTKLVGILERRLRKNER